MSKCTIALERGVVRNKKADDRHVDNDWLVIWWNVDGEAEPRIQLHQVRDLEGHREIAKGSQLAPIIASIDVPDDAAVIATAAIINLNSIDDDKQADEVIRFAKEVASHLLKAYLTAGVIAFDIAFAIGLGGLGAAIAAAGTDLAMSYEGELQKALAAVFDDVVGPVAHWFVDLWNRLLGPPRCDGEVLCQPFVFSPAWPRGDRVTREYRGPQHNRGCGDPPITEVSWWVERDGVPRYAPLPHSRVPGLIWALSPRRAHVAGRPEHEDRTVHDLLWYNHHEREGSWDGPRTLGFEWDFRQVFPGVGGTLYAITDDGTLAWFRNRGFRTGTWAWGAGRRNVGSGWSLPPSNPAATDLIGALCDTRMDIEGELSAGGADEPPLVLHRPDDRPARADLVDIAHGPLVLVGLGGGAAATDGQVIYALKGDGSLWWYAHEGFATGEARWANGGQGRRLSGQWREGNRRVFSGGLGVLYVIKHDGSLRWTRHTGVRTGEDTWLGGHQVGEGWHEMLNVFSTGAGRVYAIDRAGDLWLYRHEGWATGEIRWLDRVRVGNGWAGTGFTVAANSISTMPTIVG